MINTETLTKKAEAGDIKAIKTLAQYYDKKSGRWTDEPKVGESVSIDELFANQNREEDEDCKVEAFKWFMRGAELGDPECMFEVGARIYDSIGCNFGKYPENGKKAFDWYLKSAQAGYAPAMRITAYMLSELCVEKNEPESFRWYLKAAELGEKTSMAEVAKYYALGKGTEKNLDAANEWLAKLDNESYRRTLHELADYDDDKIMWLDRLIEAGDGAALKFKADALAAEGKFSEALDFYIKAGKSKDKNCNPDILSEAMVQAGNIWYTGDAGEQSYEKALKYYEAAAKRNYIKAHIHCGKMYFYGRGCKKDLGKAFKHFDYAARNRERFMSFNSVAREYVGKIFELQGDTEMAYHLYELAAQDYNNQEMKLKMADAYFYGEEIPQDVDKALSLYEEAGKYDSHEYYYEARSKLAWIYALGENVEKNSAKVDEHWEKLPPQFKPATT